MREVCLGSLSPARDGSVPSYNTFTAAPNLTGFPAASVRCGFDANVLPVGPQVVARPGDGAMEVRIAEAYERHAEWSARRPARLPA